VNARLSTDQNIHQFEFGVMLGVDIYVHLIMIALKIFDFCVEDFADIVPPSGFFCYRAKYLDCIDAISGVLSFGFANNDLHHPSMNEGYK
jgi:hypothetical protein